MSLITSRCAFIIRLYSTSEKIQWKKSDEEFTISKIMKGVRISRISVRFPQEPVSGLGRNPCPFWARIYNLKKQKKNSVNTLTSDNFSSFRIVLNGTFSCF